MQNTKNFYITLVLSVLILMLWQVFYLQPKIEAQREQARVESQRLADEKAKATPGAAAGTAIAPVGTEVAPATTLSLDDALKQTQRVTIDTPSLTGSINLKGARFDDIVLKNFHETVDRTSPNIHLLAPSLVANGYYAEIGFAGADTVGTIPGPDTVWTVDGNAKLTATTPVDLTFTNDKGLTFKRTIAVDEQYMFTIADSVTNAGTAEVSLAPYGRVTRYQKPTIAATFVMHEGAIGHSPEGGLQELTFDGLEEDKEAKPEKSTGGWLGFTDKYWATALIPSPKMPYQPRYSYFSEGQTRYQSDYISDPMVVKPGETQAVETLFFAGAKEANKINAYRDEKAIENFDLMIDWGWFYFFTKPMFYLMDWLNKLIGNFGLAILATTVIVKLIFYPLANKSYISMAHMKTAQPKMLEIKEKYKDDRQKQQQAMMELYKTEKINPIAGCWPVLLQIPVFFALYKVIYTTIEMRHAPFYGWIHDLSAPDPTSIFNLFGLLPFEVPAFLMIGVWPLLMGITMFLQMRMNPTPPDPTQAAIFNWMPVIFTIMMATFPAGLIIYWAWNNFLSILQQGYIMKRHGAKIELWDNLVALFKKKPAAT
ncbi:MAG: membrane protein insertase YidC [Rhizobiaceae bacterium]